MSRWLVIGAGVCGSVIAARLGALGADVVVVDAGPDVPAGDDLFDALSVQSRVSSLMVQRVCGGPRVPYTSGVGLGGGSGINGMLMSRSTPFRHDHRVPVELVEGLDRALVDGRRVTVWDAYHRMTGDQKIRVVTSTEIVRVLVDGDRCIGAVTESGEEFSADHVVLCAGALMSPAILRRSGISSNAPGVGLQDHPSVALTYQRSASESSSGPAIARLERRGSIQLMHLRRLGVADDGVAALVVMLMTPRSRGEVGLDENGELAVSFGIGSDLRDIAEIESAVATVLSDGIEGDPIDSPVGADLSEWVRERLGSAVPTVTHASSGKRIFWGHL